MKPIKAWHFIASDRKLNYGDGRQVRKGRTHKVEGEPVLCEHGLHASVRAIDALGYAPGPIISRVEIGGEIVKGDDKVVGTERTYLWVADATDVLFEFSCWVAENALKDRQKEGHEIHPASFAAIQSRRDFQKGLITQKELDDAAAAAWLVARSAAAAWLVARTAAAAESAAWLAAAVGPVAKEKQNRKLTRMLNTLEKKG